MKVTLNELTDKIFNQFHKTRLTLDFHFVLTVEETVVLLEYLHRLKDLEVD